MSKSIFMIDDTDFPNILVNGIKFELFCELETKSGGFQSMFRECLGNEVFVKLSNDTAIAGLFSLEAGKLKQTFDYIEATISSKDGLICFESDSFPRLLQDAVKAGGRYPIIQNELEHQKSSVISGFLWKLRPQLLLGQALQEQIRSHTVLLNYRQPELDFDEARHHEMEMLGSMKIDEHSTMYAVELEPGFVVDVKVRFDTGLIYVMQNGDGSCVYDGRCTDYTYPDYEFDEAAVVKFVRDQLSRPALSEQISHAEEAQRVLAASAGAISYAERPPKDPFEL